ncbi:MAG: sugar ABC transporter permease, partial [Lachnospiraceae bacterium]|nr:sugar ABC transporter permease [Lachnospiraceae bacterium]
MKRKEWKERGKLLLINLFLILICFATLVPILYAFSVSLNEQNSLLGSDFSFIPQKMTLENYRKVFMEEPVL